MNTYEEHLKCREAYKEHGDCTVRALSNLLDCSYGLAHRKLAKHGRPHGRGATWDIVEKACKEICEMKGRTVSWHGYPQYNARAARFSGYKVQTINQFIRSNPKGVYLISMCGHVATIVDSQIIDWTASTAGRRQVTGYIKLEG